MSPPVHAGGFFFEEGVPPFFFGVGALRGITRG
jgi:hypothetical protein